MTDRFELDDKVLRGETKRMSLGVKQKLAVVTVFMSDPEVLILEEPTSGLDPVMQESFIQFIHEEKARGRPTALCVRPKQAFNGYRRRTFDICSRCRDARTFRKPGYPLGYKA